MSATDLVVLKYYVYDNLPNLFSNAIYISAPNTHLQQLPCRHAHHPPLKEGEGGGGGYRSCGSEVLGLRQFAQSLPTLLLRRGRIRKHDSLESDPAILPDCL